MEYVEMYEYMRCNYGLFFALALSIKYNNALLLRIYIDLSID